MREDICNRLVGMKINIEKGIESYGDSYEDELKRFISGYDFMRLGQAVNSGRFETAAMCVRRMTVEAEKLGLDCFKRQFSGLRQNIAAKNSGEVKNILSLIIVKRIQIQDVLKNH